MLLLDHLHPAVVHFPIAFLLAGSATGLLYLFWRPVHEVRVFTWWLLIAGWITCMFAVLTGLLAQRNLSPDAPYHDVLNWHIGAGLAVLVVYGALLYMEWLGWARRRAGKAAVDLLDDSQRRVMTAVLLGVGAGLVFLSGWNGGVLVYEWGVNVAR
jgi:uncharacterized membrane protein